MRSSSVLSFLALSTLTAACAIAPGDPTSELVAPPAETVGAAASADQTSWDNVVCRHEKSGYTYYTLVQMERGRAMSGIFSCDNDGTVAEDVDMPLTKPVYTNNSSNYSIWITIYDAGQLQHLDYGCVSAKSSRRWASGNYQWGSFYHVRAEVKYNADCTGPTLFDTSMQINPNATASTSFGGMTGTSSDLIVDLIDSGSGYYLATGNSKAGPNGAFNGTFDAGPFLFWSRVNGVSEVLSVDPNCTTSGCGLVLEPYSATSQAQQWLRSGSEHEQVLTNVQTGMVAYAPAGQGSRAMLLDPVFVKYGWLASSEITWNLAGDLLSNFALRPLRDAGQNLNVFGNGPYPAGSAVGTWGWGGGAPNETWVATRVPTYQGCFADGGSRALPTQLLGGGATIGSCTAAAKKAGLTYAGLQYGGQCWGGASLDANGRVPESDCNMPCSAAADETCGSGWRNSVYLVH